VKTGAVAAELTALGVPFEVICTGQHTDLLRGTPAETDLSPARSLGLASSGNFLRWLDASFSPLCKALAGVGPVVVQGDTMSALAAARAAHALNRPVHHVEAGLRSGDLQNPWPEEGIRREISWIADVHYAPTERAKENLREVGRFAHVTGNTVVSALARYTDARPVSVPGNHILVTMHRREWLLSESAVETIKAIARVGRWSGQRILWPVHPSVEPLLGRMEKRDLEGISLEKPMSYQVATRCLATAIGVVTDSGGLQEEAATLGVPCAVMRYVSDRPESIELGLARRYDPTPDGVKYAFQCILKDDLPRQPSDCYGTPAAASIIAKHLAGSL
jgi:UDP-N-acetylglucosamine 2-epimerase (non-hydrolysing)